MQTILNKIKSSTFKHLAGAVLLSSTYFIIQFIFTKIISAKISVEDFGEYRYFFAILSFGALFNLGFNDGFQVEWIVKKNPINYKYIVASLIITIITSFVSMFLFNDTVVGLLAVFNLVIVNAQFIYQSVFVKHNYFLFYLLPIIFAQLVQSIVLLLFDIDITFLQIIYLHTAVSLFFMIGVFLYSIRVGHFKKENSILFSLQEIPGYLKSGLPILLSGIVLIGFLNVDKLILKDKFPEIDYGYYCFASMIALVVYGVFVSMASMLLKKMVDADNVSKIYNNTIYLLLAVPLLVLAGKGIVIKGIEVFFPKFIPSFVYFIGFTNFYFPLLANNLVMLNYFKRNQNVSVFAFVAVLFLFVQSILLYVLIKMGVALTEMPYLMSIVIMSWFLVNDYIVSKQNQAIRHSYLKRTIICTFSFISVFLITYYFR